MRNKKRIFISAVLISAATLFFIYSGDHGSRSANHAGHSDEKKSGVHEKKPADHGTHTDGDDHGSDHKSEKEEGHSSEHESESAHSAHEKIKEGMAVQDFCEENGLLLSPEAAAVIGIKTVRVSAAPGGNGAMKVPAGSLVYYRDRVCIIYKKSNRFIMKDVRVIKTEGSSASIKIPDTLSIEIVSKGADLLRLAFLEASGATGSGHIH